MKEKNMATKCKIFVTVTSHLIDFCKDKYDIQTRNTQVIINVKEYIWLLNINTCDCHLKLLKGSIQRNVFCKKDKWL